MNPARRPTRVAAAAVLLGTLVLGAMPAAGAATWTHRDATGDVTRSTASATSPAETEIDRADKSTDITRLTVAHRNRRLVITTRFRDLVAGGSNSLAVVIRTPDGPVIASLSRMPDMRSFMLIPAEEDDEDFLDPTTTCAAKKARFDAGSDRIRLDIPRSCLGDPAWVRVNAVFMRGDLLTMSPDATFTLDNALRTGRRGLMGGNSPKIRVG